MLGSRPILPPPPLMFSEGCSPYMEIFSTSQSRLGFYPTEMSNEAKFYSYLNFYSPWNIPTVMGEVNLKSLQRTSFPHFSFVFPSLLPCTACFFCYNWPPLSLSKQFIPPHWAHWSNFHKTCIKALFIFVGSLRGGGMGRSWSRDF